jgi:hypothetical protein
MKSRWFVVAMLVVLVASVALVPAAQAASAKQIATLKASTAYPSATGKAVFKDKPGEQEFQVEVEHVKALAGTQLKVMVDGKQVGTMKVNSLGAARLNRNSTRGQTVPAIHSGSIVRVRTASGVLVASGKFQ